MSCPAAAPSANAASLREPPASPRPELLHAGTDKKPPIYGYMRAYDSTPESQLLRDELVLFQWAQAGGYDLTLIYKEVDEGSVAELTELVEELRRTGDRAVVVPSMEHFGSGRVLQDHLWAYVVHCADAEIYQAVGVR
ncbi:MULTISPECIES: hypothetical protein [unclassified Streptomyces]|uniref:hypothetical protein n=1 Tax=unclassified Streptomyces TaxID=2593676 RepID=UPI002E2C4FA3|nr:hypothetical protein [Streptomyces sp. NBC_00223]